MTTPTWGQWRGVISGTNAGHVVVNIDRDRPSQARIQVDDPNGPFVTLANIKTVSDQRAEFTLSELHPYRHAEPPPNWPTSGSVVLSTDSSGAMSGTWSTDVDTSGRLTLMSVQPSVPGDQPGTLMSWRDFMSWALAKASSSGWVFRGQDTATYALSSSFHRSNRCDLYRYDQEDVSRLKRALEAVLGTSFRLEHPDDYGTLLNIAQHHGFPTPLIDFTSSPFVAAYFAFSTVRQRKCASSVPVRIFALSPAMRTAVSNILEIRPVVARLTLGARLNPRVVPQQSVNIFTNVPDVEGFVRLRELEVGSTLLERVDIPADEAPRALHDLRTFGISALSLFPGVEGACRGLAEERFPDEGAS